MSNSLRPHRLWPTRLLRPWDSPGKNTGVVAISFSRGSSRPRDRTWVPHIAGRLFILWGTRGAPQPGEFGIKMMPTLPAWKLILILIGSLWSQATHLPGGWGVTWTPTPAYGALHGFAWPMAVTFTKYITYWVPTMWQVLLQVTRL